MTEGRPSIPQPLRRQVLVEAGHRCAIPACKQVPVELAHIVPWATVKEHAFENLIALCPTCHARYDRDEIDRQAMLMYKRNLGLVSSRYGEGERRLLDLFVQNPGRAIIQFEHSMDFEFMYLMQDGLLVKIEEKSGMYINGVRTGPERYALTPQGVQFVNHLREGSALDNGERHE